MQNPPPGKGGHKSTLPPAQRNSAEAQALLAAFFAGGLDVIWDFSKDFKLF